MARKSSALDDVRAVLSAHKVVGFTLEARWALMKEVAYWLGFKVSEPGPKYLPCACGYVPGSSIEKGDGEQGDSDRWPCCPQCGTV